MKLLPHWSRSGWKASARGGEIIEYSCYLPPGRTMGQVRREGPGKRWKIKVGDGEFHGRGFRSASDAMYAVEAILRGALRSALKQLESRA